MPPGQPPKFKKVEDLQKAIDEYFDWCDNRVVKVYSKTVDDVVEINKPEPYTIEGLCLAMGISRQTLLNYEKTEGYERFFDTVKRAKMRVQKCMVLTSLEGQAAGAIFNLKNNFGYKDSQELTGDPDKPLFTGIKRIIVDPKEP